MILSKSFFVTKKNNINEEDNPINKLLIKSGIIYKNSSGVFTFLPYGLKILENICKIIDEECKKRDINKLLLPSLVREELFIKSSRNELLGDLIYKIKDRNNKNYMLTPTHEELFTDIVSMKVESYKDLHFSLYQISNKFRDEIKPKGIIQKKEFLMFDAYSFDADESGLDISYDNMNHIFKKIFKRFDIDTIRVKSDPKDMYAYLSEEFQFISSYGNDNIVKCTKCNYLSNSDIAEIKINLKNPNSDNQKLELIETPNCNSIKDVSKFLNCKKGSILKSLIYKVDNKYKMILIEGTAEINEYKLSKFLGTKNISLASEEEIKKLGSAIGYVGPIKSTMEIIADYSVVNMNNFIIGANKEGYHYKNVNIPRDFKVKKYADIKMFDEKCKCPKCGSKVEILKGLEIGNIFKLGTGYSRKLDVSYTNEKNEKNYIHMGSYGLGLERCLFAIAQAHNDKKGILWPYEIAPYKVAIVIANINDKDAKEYAEKLYNKLLNLKIEVILDDRKVTLGTKLNDMDLIGVPIRITVGKGLIQNKVELKLRNEIKVLNINKDRVIDKIKKIIEY